MSTATTETNSTPVSPLASEEQRARLDGLMSDRGFDPSVEVHSGGPTLTQLADEFRRISILEVAPVPGIEWMQRTSRKLGVGQEVADNLWRAYERQVRDELDHGAYWGELYFLLTGEPPAPMPWDGDGMGGSNVKISVPSDSDDEDANRLLLFMGAAYALGLESGFAEFAFPALMKLMKSSELAITRSMVPLLRQIGRDEARHLTIHRYAFWALHEHLGPDATANFHAMANSGRRNFGVPEFTDAAFARFVGRTTPPTTDKLLGPLHLTLA